MASTRKKSGVTAKKQSIKSADQQKLQQAVALIQSGNSGQAQVLCLKLHRKYPIHPEILHLLGVIAFQQQQFDDAAHWMDRASAVAPSNAHYACEVARIELKRGRPAVALARYRRAAKQALPAAVYSEIGAFCYRYGEIALAAECFQQALRQQPRDSTLTNNLAKCYFDSLRTDEAEALYRQNLLDNPGDRVSLNNLAEVLRGKRDEAAGMKLYQDALRAAPDDWALKTGFADFLVAIKHSDEGEALYREVLATRPSDLDATLALCQLLAKDRPSEALQRLRALLAKTPGNGRANRAMGGLLTRFGDTDEAEAHFAKALRLLPYDTCLHDDHAFLSNYRPAEDGQQIRTIHQSAAVALQESVFCAPFVWSGDRDPQRRLTVAYLSPDLHRHSVSYFLEPLLRGHDRQQVRVLMYSDSANLDAVNQRLRTLADDWVDVAGISNNGLRAQIIRDRVDILVELAGHTGHNRLPVLAAQAAPVQISYLGYPRALALPVIPYRISDAIADPVARDDNTQAQQRVRLAGGFLCYQPDAFAPPPELPPHLRRGSITFGSFNVREKISLPTLRLWAQVLDAVPGSRLLLKAGGFADAHYCQYFIQQSQGQGIGADRLTLIGNVEGAGGHLPLYHEVDIALDTLSYNGTTTTCETLWMGVPVITLRGDCHAARVGSSLLTQLGLQALIADDADDYRRIALELAADSARLTQLRVSMRDRMLTSPLMDRGRIAREMEAAYREIWQTFCAAPAG